MMLHKINNSKYRNILEYISLILVLSFPIIHNITIVLIGMIVAYFSIYKKEINEYIAKYNSNEIKKESLETSLELLDNNDGLDLAKKVEELGFIPSQENL